MKVIFFLAFKIGFLPVSIWDILDVLIVGYLLYLLYKLLRGSLAFNIFVGIVLLYGASWLVSRLGMTLTSGILNLFVSTGVLAVIIIFQPEIRRFLLLLGDQTLRQRSNMLDRLLDRNLDKQEPADEQINALASAILRMSRRRIGALIVLGGEANLTGVVSGGTAINADISEGLLLSIFSKESPLHDGAVIVINRRIVRASCILPVSENSDLPESVGLRHRAAVGLTEKTSASAFIVSEETGNISVSYNGNLERKMNEERLRELLNRYLS